MSEESIYTRSDFESVNHDKKLGWIGCPVEVDYPGQEYESDGYVRARCYHPKCQNTENLRMFDCTKTGIGDYRNFCPDHITIFGEDLPVWKKPPAPPMSEVAEILETLDKEIKSLVTASCGESRPEELDYISKILGMLRPVQALLQTHAVIDKETTQHLSLMAVANESSCVSLHMNSEEGINKCRIGRVGQSVDLLKAELSRLTNKD